MISIRKSQFLFIVALVLLIGNQSAHAEPIIDDVAGVVEHGLVVTLTGSMFGSKRDHNNTDSSWSGRRHLAFRVKDFEDQSLSSGGFISPNESWLIRNGGRTGEGFFATKWYNGQRLGTLGATQRNTTGVWYMSFWMMLGPGPSAGKFFRIYGSGDARNIYLGANLDSDFRIRGYSECVAPECSTATVWSSPDRATPNSWHRVEVIMFAGGVFQVWMNGRMQWERDNWVANVFGGDGHTIDIGAMIDKPGPGHTNDVNDTSYNFDDIYYDFSLARVELSDSSTWAESRHREIQIPLSWTDNEITIAVNSGSFTEGKALFLYVVDASGYANPVGVPVSLGASGTVTRPKAPDIQAE